MCVREEEDKKELLGDQQRLPTPALHCIACGINGVM